MHTPDTTKHPARSLTLWVNALAAIVTEAIASLPGLKEHLPPDYYAYAFYALALANVGLRALTTQPLRWTRRRDGEHS